MKKLAIASVTTLAAALLAPALTLAAIETSPYRYDPHQDRCLNHQGLQGMRLNFRGTCGDLWGADMKNADLKGTNLSGANLCRADLSGADLTGANLSGASMLLTRIRDTKLEGAIFNERTVLPFSRKEAAKRGMVFVPRVATAQEQAPVARKRRS